MKQITQTGATNEQAISEALAKLGTTRDQVTIEVVQEAKKGFLGIGAKPAEVLVTVNEIEETQAVEPEPVREETVTVESVLPTEVKQETVTDDSSFIEVEGKESTEEDRVLAINETETYLQTIAEGMKIDDLTVHSTLDGKYVHFQLESKKAAMLIGKRGQTLNALQQLSQLVLNKYSKQFLVAKVDVENYRERRQESLEQLAERMADKAIRTGRKVEFEPMPSYERKVIHHALSTRLDIETFSVGTDPNRYLVIEPLK
ncbi:RNA-binding cell elongation regulator Jag/EloR [Paenisporosarcina cavernae]|uniref:RNA-binding protein KhpB n=1 Tax=Paenisporosarcina cavernae TaxID=2320858 RepID=A0A385YNZ0_9BACL|nr:RNA-binding cell elongation regulator Jag/EloR [Paenisporosarcina cavernae]AYC28379.1 protein jag [Paenisporosarcina cavernae]